MKTNGAFRRFHSVFLATEELLSFLNGQQSPLLPISKSYSRQIALFPRPRGSGSRDVTNVTFKDESFPRFCHNVSGLLHAINLENVKTLLFPFAFVLFFGGFLRISPYWGFFRISPYWILIIKNHLKLSLQWTYHNKVSSDTLKFTNWY